MRVVGCGGAYGRLMVMSVVVRVRVVRVIQVRVVMVGVQVMIRLLLLVSLLESGSGGHCIVVASAVVRVIEPLAAKLATAFLVRGSFRLVAVVLEPVILSSFRWETNCGLVCLLALSMVSDD